MVDGKFWKILALAVLFLVPVASAAAPQTTFPSPFSLGGQDISDLSIDPFTGNFGMAVPVYDGTKLPPLPGQPTHRDVYVCDFPGSGCSGLLHTTTYGSGTAQVVDAVGFYASNGPAARYAVGGPGSTISLWSNIGQAPIWEKAFPSNLPVVSVAVEPNAGSYVVAAGDDAINGKGIIAVFKGSSGEIQWSYAIDPDARPVDIDHARNGGRLVVGTTKGIFFLNPADAAAPVARSQTNPVDLPSVRDVILSRAGDAVVVRTSSDIRYIPIGLDGAPASPHWSRGLTPAPSAIAFSGDGKAFAAAAGSKIYFFNARNDSLLAESDIHSSYDVGTTVTSLDYDNRGSLLVATAGNRVLGFAKGQSGPIWAFDATSASGGALDGPLREVVISDDASRIVVAGATKIMPYKTERLASLAVVGQPTRTIVPGTSLNLSMEVTNTGSLPDNYTFVVTRPIGWSGSNPAGFALNPDQLGRINFTVDAPNGQRPGTEAVKVEVRSLLKNEVIASASINLTVPRAVSLIVELAQERLVLQPGVDTPVEVTIRNVGNAPGLVNLTVEQIVSRGSSWQARFDQRQLTVPDNAAVTTQLTLTAPNDASSGDRNTVTVVAKEGETRATRTLSAFINPEFTVDLSTGSTVLKFPSRESRTFTVNITNRGNTDDTYNVTANVTPLSYESEWSVRLTETQLTVQRGQTRTISLTIRPAIAEPHEDASLVIKAVSLGSGEVIDDSVSVALVPTVQDEDTGRGIPAPSLAIILAAFVGIAFARRQRRGSA